MRNIFLNLIAQYCVMVDLKKAILKNFKYVFVNLGDALDRFPFLQTGDRHFWPHPHWVRTTSVHNPDPASH